MDRSHQEVLLFKKNLGCGVFCCFCKNQFLEVWAAPGELIGCIQQDYGVLSQEIVLLNSDINTMFRIPIPFLNALRMPKETHFRVLDRDRMTQKGTITRAWNVNTASYTNNIYYSDPTMDVKFKSLFIAAAFMLVRSTMVLCVDGAPSSSIPCFISGISLLSIELLLRGRVLWTPITTDEVRDRKSNFILN